MARSLHRRALLAVAFLALTSGCRRAAAGDDTLVVFAASSLRDVFTALGADLERAHPGVTVRFNFAGTQELRTQLEHGSAADVFASADVRHMDAVVAAGRAAQPTVFARNALVLVFSTERPDLQGLEDLPRARRVVLGAPEVPVGRYALELLDRARARFGDDFRARVEARVVSRELNVRQVLTKVSLGEAEAGVVYRSDARAAGGRVRTVPVPEDLEVVADYAVAPLVDAKHPALARAFLELLASDAGRRALDEAGFLPPTGKVER